MNVPIDVRRQSLKLGMRDHDRPETFVDNDVLWTMHEKNPRNAVIDYAKEFSASPISMHII